MALNIFISPVSQFFDDNGDPLAGGKLYTYEPGTTTLKTAYTDQDGTEAATNPVILDGRGECTLWLDGEYKFVLKDSSDVTKWTEDNISGAIHSDEISGYKTINFTSDADYTVSAADAKNAVLVFTDTGTVLTTGRNVILPTDTRILIVENDSAQTLTFKTSAGTGKAVTAGRTAFVRGDGTNVVSAFGEFAEMPTVGGSPIVESGSNANGSYIRFSNGIQICWHSVDVTWSGSTISSPATWTFPAEFSAAPLCQATAVGGVVIYIAKYIIQATTGISALVSGEFTSAQTVTRPSSVMAVGTW